jgi:hypothetical protein
MNYYDETMKVLENFDISELLSEYQYRDFNSVMFESICLDCLELLEELDMQAPSLDAIQDFVAMIA